MLYEKKYVWSVLFRVYHWAIALAIITLAVTGTYINTPWTNTMLEGSFTFPMATMRTIHFYAAYLFTAGITIRLYLILFGNTYEKIWDFVPLSERNIKNLWRQSAFYLYLTDKHDRRLGHNVFAGVMYVITFILGLGQLITGFYLLYPESIFWQQIGITLFGPQQQARIIHYLLMWYFMIFVTFHLYILVWNDIRCNEGLLSSIFTGYKFTPKEND